MRWNGAPQAWKVTYQTCTAWIDGAPVLPPMTLILRITSTLASLSLPPTFSYSRRMYWGLITNCEATSVPLRTRSVSAWSSCSHYCFAHDGPLLSVLAYNLPSHFRIRDGQVVWPPVALPGKP